jgi:hypothetical protein
MILLKHLQGAGEWTNVLIDSFSRHSVKLGWIVKVFFTEQIIPS